MKQAEAIRSRRLYGKMRARCGMPRKGKQLELPLPRVSAAERRAWIRDRLAGLEFRQRMRQQKRRAAAWRRKHRHTQLAAAETAPRQLPITEIDLP